MSELEQAINQMRAEKSCPACYQDPFAGVVLYAQKQLSLLHSRRLGVEDQLESSCLMIRILLSLQMAQLPSKLWTCSKG